MPVKCLTSDEQTLLVKDFHNGWSIEALCDIYIVSRRTVLRVLDAHKVDTGIKRRVRKPKALPPPTNIEERKFYPPQTDNMPWIYRMAHKVRDFFTS